MAKAMMFTRKAAPSTGGDNNDKKPVDGDETGGPENEQTDDKDTVKCPNCECEFNDETMEVVKPGKPVEGGYDEAKNQGADLEIPDEPDGMTHFGAAHDAAGGEAAITQALASALGRGK